MNTLSPPHAPVRLVAPLALLTSLVPLASLAPPVAFACAVPNTHFTHKN